MSRRKLDSRRTREKKEWKGHAWGQKPGSHSHLDIETAGK